MYNTSNSTHHASADGTRTEVGHFLNYLNMMLKPAITIQDQITLLQHRGMIFAELEFAKGFLLRNNYYRLNIYFHRFMDEKNCFIGDTTFDKIIKIYDNDRWLRNKLLGILEPIEIRFRTGIAYFLGITYGSDCYYKEVIYSDPSRFEQVNESLQREIEHRSKESVVLHHKEKYNGQFPIWVIVEFLSFNAISKYYSSLKYSDQKNIAENTFEIGEYYYTSWIHALSVLRNICAHHGYLYLRTYSVKPKLFKEHSRQFDNDNLFAFSLILKRLSERQTWNEFIKNLVDRENNGSLFTLRDYGFPENWYNLLTQ